jgi:DNA-binding MarR family transcriptional regulator
MKKELIIELIELLDHFDSEFDGGSDYSLRDFVGYLNAQVGTEQLSMRKIEGDKQPDVQLMRIDSNTDTSILITLMFRYAKGYAKKALLNSSIQTADEFAFLITLMTHESLTKTELINTQVMEKTSGVEVIKRLVSQGMIEECADDQDRRSVRVKITLLGRMEIIKVLPEMSKVSRVVVGNLTQPEINTLTYLLKKLDFYHNDIFLNKRNLGLDELLEG